MNPVWFGPFHYNPQTGCLSRDDSQQVLRHQVNLLLQTFLRHEGILLSRETLIAAVWPQEHVEANTFFQCMNHLRKALGESSQDPQFIQNYPRKGYVWMCPIHTRNPHSSAKRISPVKITAFAATITLVLLSLGTGLSKPGEATSIHPQEEGATATNTSSIANNSSVQLGLVKPVTPTSIVNSVYLQKGTSPATRVREMRSHYTHAFGQAKLAFKQGNPLRCEQLLVQILEQANQDHYPHAQATALLARAKISRFRNPNGAKTSLEKARDLYRNLEDGKKYSEATYILALIHLDLGEMTAAEELIEHSLAVRGPRQRQQKVYYALAKGLFHLKNGDIAMAEKALFHSKRLKKRARVGKTHIQIAMLEAAILAAQGHIDLAKTITRDALDQLQRMTQPLITLQAQWLMGHLNALSHDVQGASQHYHQVRRQAEIFEMEYFQAKTAWALSQLPQSSQAQEKPFPLSPNHRRLFERWEKNPDAKNLPIGTQLFNL